MRTTTLRSAPAIAVAALALTLSATGGAVAGSLITGAQIKDNTVTTKDLRDGTIRTVDVSAAARAALQGDTGPAGPPGISGYEQVGDTTPVASGATGTAAAQCPAGKQVLGVTGWFWSGVPNGVQTRIQGSYGIAYGTNSLGFDTVLVVQVTCAYAS